MKAIPRRRILIVRKDTVMKWRIDGFGSKGAIHLGPLKKTFYFYNFNHVSNLEWCVPAPAPYWDIPITLPMRLGMSRDTQ